MRNNSPKIVNLKKTQNEREHEKSDPSITREQKLEKLLAYESEVRGAQSLRELYYCLANETLQLTKGEQIFVVVPHTYSSRKYVIDVVSNLSSVDKNAPALVYLEACFSRAIANAIERKPEERNTPFLFDFPRAENSSIQQFAVLLPLFNFHEGLIGTLVVVSDNPVFISETPLLMRVINVAQHAWRAFLPRKRNLISGKVKNLFALFIIILTFMALFIKVPLSALAPVEIVARDPQVVAAPINGVIEKILVDANSEVLQGTPLFQYVDTAMSADLKVAQQKWAVASAKLQTAQQNSFGAGEGRREIIIAKAELELAQAELNFAKAQFDQSIVKSPAPGVAVFDRKTEWQGKPVSVGERVIEVANISQLEARIDLAVSDAIVIENEARVQLFLDSSPLSPLEGAISSSAYRARLDSSNQLSFKLFVDIEVPQNRVLRVGARGTAQVYGEDVTLAFYLFRRPLSAMRQWIGW